VLFHFFFFLFILSLSFVFLFYNIQMPVGKFAGAICPIIFSGAAENPFSG
jgi:hypothetical protein